MKIKNVGNKINELESDLAENTKQFNSELANESATLGTELVDSTGWTLAGWTGDFANGFIHTIGQTLPLTRSIPTTGTKLYLVEFRVESVTPAGDPNASTDFTVTIGNSAPFVTYKGGGSYNYSFGIQSVSDGNLSIIPLTTFDGTIKNITVKEIISGAIPTMVIKDSTGTNAMEIRPTSALLNNVFMGLNAGKYNVKGDSNIALGGEALATNTTGFWNSAIGALALEKNTVGSRCIAIGYRALEENISGDRNIAIGTFAQERTTTGRENISMGADSLWYNTTGNYNMALGHYALGANISGEGNIGIGRLAGNEGTTGNYNISIGNGALLRNKIGNSNIAIGRDTLKNNSVNGNIAIGEGSMVATTTGAGNIAIGGLSLRMNTTGYDNTAIGNLAGYGTTGLIYENVLIGANSGFALTNNAGRNVLIGVKAGLAITSGGNNILIGYNVQTENPTDSAKLNIGNTIYGNLTGKSIGIGVVNPTAGLHIKAGTLTEAPLKLTTGVLTTTPNIGAIEFDGTNLYFTNSSGTRKILAVVA